MSSNVLIIKNAFQKHGIVMVKRIVLMDQMNQIKVIVKSLENAITKQTSLVNQVLKIIIIVNTVSTIIRVPRERKGSLRNFFIFSAPCD